MTCSYCGRDLLVVQGATQVQAQLGARAITDRLLSGYTGEDVGNARRYSEAEMEARNWRAVEHALWPIAASASSTFGGSWGPDVLVGPPTVFPRHGDIRGAWAPRTRDSHVEWIELRYAPDAPLVRAIRVFETNLPGASFAITILDAQGEELLWQRRPELTGNAAQVLELELAPPRHVGRLRVYVNNDVGTGWSEIDTVGLVTSEPLPPSMRAAPPPVPKPMVFRALGCLAAAASALAVAVLIAVIAGDSSSVTPLPPRAGEVVAGSSLRMWGTSAEELHQARIVWAGEAVAFSSQFAESRNAAFQALGPPDVFPTHVDSPAAWASAGQDDGAEFLEVRFASPVLASAVVIVETLNPGALARVEDVTEGRPAAVLWEGMSRPYPSARVLAIDLAEPRAIDALRVILDTQRVSGWNELDAIGLQAR